MCGDCYYFSALVSFCVFWCKLARMGSTMAMPVAEPTRRTISLPPQIADKIETIASQRRVTTNRVIINLIEDGIAAYENRRVAFMELADQFQKSTDPAETERLREELIDMTFGS